MGAMKVLATKDAEGRATVAEKKMIQVHKELEDVRHLIPLPSVRYEQKGDGPQTQLLYLAWPRYVIEKFQSNKQMYFFCWSQNWRDSEKFHAPAFFLPLDQVTDFFHGNGKADVLKIKVEGPYDPAAFDKSYLPFSPYADLKQADVVKKLSEDEVQDVRPTYLWLATLVK